MRTKRKILFRLSAVLLGLSVFVLFELVCRLAGWGADSTANDAFSEFASVRPLFVRDADDARFVVAENRRGFFAEDSFPVEKTQKRVFVLGGSTVQGRPFSIPTSFATFLEIGLNHTDPDHDWKVINCGGISYASYRLLPIMEECMQYEPDLFIVCTGHNEFLESRDSCD